MVIEIMIIYKLCGFFNNFVKIWNHSTERKKSWKNVVMSNVYINKKIDQKNYS